MSTLKILAHLKLLASNAMFFPLYLQWKKVKPACGEGIYPALGATFYPAKESSVSMSVREIEMQ